MKRLECMDGLRGVLAVYVMAGHMAPFVPLPHWLGHALSHGGAAVDMFFILSGLVIAGSLARFRYRPAPFLIARAARIYPVFGVVFAAALLVQALPPVLPLMPWVTPDSPARAIWADGWPGTWVVDIAAHLTMTHGLFPDGILPHAWVSILGSAWSLSTEWQFYVLALFAGRALARRGGAGPALGWVFVGLAVAGLAWAWAAPPEWRFSRAFLGNRAHFFALGIVSAGLIAGVPGARRTYAAMLAATLLVCLAQGGWGGKLLPPLAWTLCLAIQVAPRSGSVLAAGGMLLRSGPAQVLGAWSYGIYLVNEPVQKALGTALATWCAGDRVLFTALWLPGALVLPVLAAWGLHAWIERPALAWGRGRAAGIGRAGDHPVRGALPS